MTSAHHPSLTIPSRPEPIPRLGAILRGCLVAEVAADGPDPLTALAVAASDVIVEGDDLNTEAWTLRVMWLLPGVLPVSVLAPDPTALDADQPRDVTERFTRLLRGAMGVASVHLDEVLGDLLDGDACHTAAHAALRPLFEAWKGALVDGARIEDLTPDVERVIAAMRTARTRVLRGLATQRAIAR